jgi:hypothetical protein
VFYEGPTTSSAMLAPGSALCRAPPILRSSRLDA